jgi:cell division septum initiation protein DivIVA
MLSIQMDIENIIKENKSLKEENNKLKTLLENYNTSRKSYYEKNKEIVNEKAKQRLKKIAEEDPERLKEINRKAYLKRKEKLQKLETTKVSTTENI